MARGRYNLSRKLQSCRPHLRRRCRVKYRVLVEQDEDGVFVAEVPSLPGCVSQGATRAEALENVREAIAVYLESLEAHGEPVPPPITEELVEVEA